ncbi:MAG: rRNA maturation RNase YbeY [Flavobacteriales bacterium]|nr:rRNA maturation RNase YbeY [Flavobacteriales bacterium]MCB9364353.1 rRNA maturation RNase YbeY [Flavobacteriales bacterium]
MSFFSEDIDFEFTHEESCISWLKNAIKNESKIAGELSFVFCDDNYLHKINLEYLNHDTYTDIITFDYTEANIIAGDIFISIDRVKENAKTFNTLFENELSRVIIHGVLHLMGYKDKTQEESSLMRAKEDFYLNLLS